MQTSQYALFVEMNAHTSSFAFSIGDGTDSSDIPIWTINQWIIKSDPSLHNPKIIGCY